MGHFRVLGGWWGIRRRETFTPHPLLALLLLLLPVVVMGLPKNENFPNFARTHENLLINADLSFNISTEALQHYDVRPTSEHIHHSLPFSRDHRQEYFKSRQASLSREYDADKAPPSHYHRPPSISPHGSASQRNPHPSSAFRRLRRALKAQNFAAPPSEVPLQSWVERFYNKENDVEGRKENAIYSHRLSSFNRLEYSQQLSSQRSRKHQVSLSQKVKSQDYPRRRLPRDEDAAGELRVFGDGHEETYHRSDSDTEGSGQMADTGVTRFPGRRLLSMDDTRRVGADSAAGRQVRAAGEQQTSRTNSPLTASSQNCSGAPDDPGVHLVTLRWNEIGVYFTITAFVILAGLCKLGFHQMHWLSSRVPESCLLIVLGVLMGLLFFFTKPAQVDPCKPAVSFPSFTSEGFFLVLLPPIILESAYSLHDRCFIDNIGSVLVFAIFGTLFNIFLIGPSLFGLSVAGAMGSFKITLTESLVFSSLISAVDPVAVLSIFQELGVNKGLYFLVFGESLLNDGVTVVVYNMVSVFMEMTAVKAKDYVLSVVAFFVVTLCGALIGIVYGIITALVTRVTTNVRVVEPLALLGFSYLAYLTAEVFHFSGIICLIVCGLVQAQYAFQNISDKSYTCVKYFTKMASATSETIIFMFLGMVLVSQDHKWHTGFVLWTLLLCFVARVIVTLLLSAMVNHYRIRRIGMSEQLILAYGGLRGAVAFSLVTMLPEDMALKEHFITATLVVILFTVFVQGITMGPLVRWLNVAKRSSGQQILFEEVHRSVVDHMMAGIEEVLGEHGDFYLREQIRYYNETYLKRWFVRPTSEAPLKRLFEKIAITEHYAHLYGPAELLKKHNMDVYASKMNLVEEVTPYNSNRVSVQILTTENAGSDRVEQLRLEQAHPTLQRRKSSLISIITTGDASGKGGRQRSAVSSTVDLSAKQRQDDADLLRRAISGNPYNQLHYKHNRNLVNEDNQELQTHLLRRRATARRLTRLASQSSTRPPSVVGAESPLRPSTPSVPRPNSLYSGDYTRQWSNRGPPVYGNQSSVGRNTLAPDDGVQLRQSRDGPQPNESSWSRPPPPHLRPLPGRLTSLPGEIHALSEDELAELPGGEDLMRQVKGVNAILQNARRRSMWRRVALQNRMAKTLSEGDGSARDSVYSDALPPSTGGGSSSVHPVPKEPSGDGVGKPSCHHIAVDIQSTTLSDDDPLAQLVAALPKSTDEDSARSPYPLSGYSSDYSTTGYSTDSTLPLAAQLPRPTFRTIPEQPSTAEEPLLPGGSSGRRHDGTSPKNC